MLPIRVFFLPNNVKGCLLHSKACILSGAKIGSWGEKNLSVMQWIMVLHISTLLNKILFLSINFLKLNLLNIFLLGQGGG